jgi:hypothetical protein
MRVIHRLVGYDRNTDRPARRFEIAIGLLPQAKQIADVADDDPDALWSYSLSAAQVRELAALLGVKIESEAIDFFLEAFAEPADLDNAPS